MNGVPTNGQTRVPQLPSFGKKEEGDHAQDQGAPYQAHQGQSYQAHVKQEEDVRV